jgi:hypothetical protein
MSIIPIPSERPVPESIRWYYYLHLCGDEGENWLLQYEMAKGMDVARRLDNTIRLCRRRRFEEAHSILAGCLNDLEDSKNKVDRSVFSVMERWYFSTKAYMLYTYGDYDGARDNLAISSEAIRIAISEAYFLVGLAIGFAEFTVHYARIARDECKWDDMKRYLDLARAMHEDSVPLCELSDGRSIFAGTVDSFLATLSPRNDEEESSLRFLLNRDVLINSLELLIRRVEAMPNVVVPFA